MNLRLLHLAATLTVPNAEKKENQTNTEALTWVARINLNRYLQFLHSALRCKYPESQCVSVLSVSVQSASTQRYEEERRSPPMRAAPPRMRTGIT